MAERRRVDYSVHRDVMHKETVDNVFNPIHNTTTVREKVQKSVSCSGPRAKKCLVGSVPVVSWLPRYSFRENILGDIISGISVGIMHLPQGMAYAILASVPAVYGLYSSFYPVLVYFIFGTSKHISVGTYAVMSVMIGGVTERLAPDSAFSVFDNVTGEAIINTTLRDVERVKVAAAVTFLSGIFQVLLGLVQFGFVVMYLSEPLVRGYTTGAAIHVIVSQLKYTFGISPTRFSGPLALIYTVLEICSLLPKTNLGTLVVSAVSIVCLILAKELNAYLGKRLPVPIPVELLGIVVATVVSWQVDLNGRYGIDVVGGIPSGLQPPALPKVSLFSQVIGDAFAISVVGYGLAISLGRIFALKYGYKVDSNQELIAFGLSNTFGGIFQCFAISCSMSRSMVQVSTGGRSQVAGALSAVVILVITMWIGQLFEDLPKAMLAAIIYVNLQGIMKQFMDIPALWRSNRIDMVACLCPLLSHHSILNNLFSYFRPTYSLLGQIPDTDIYRPLNSYEQVKKVPDVVVFRSSATLYFANAEMYQEALGRKVLVCSPPLQQVESDGAEMKDVAVIDVEPEQDPSLPRAIVLDLSPVNFLDTVGVKTLKNIKNDYEEIGIKVVLTGCLPGVLHDLQTGGFFNDKVTKCCVFSSIHDAVLHCQCHCGTETTYF
uniref:Solute carrier family 26 member 6 n=1 Tax=Neogobius melanostomus TaxID=47308 RepID=A0A8C6WFD4_9GOBI